MQTRLIAVILAALCTCGFAAAQSSPDFVPGRPSWEERNGPIRWPVGATLLQGYFGVNDYSNVAVMGGGGQWKLGGEVIDVGLESMLSFSGSADVTAFAAGGSGGAIAVDVDLRTFELFGGPFASTFLGEKLRIYGAVGPLLQFVDYSQSSSSLDTEGDGFGSGWYARAGVELALPSYTFIGMGVRWSDTRVDLGSGLDDLDIEGMQIFVTVSRGI